MIKKLTNIKIHNNTIIIDGHDSKVHVDGPCLETALLIDDNYILLFVTFDCPFEEGLEIYLLDLQQNRIIDKAQLAQMYYTDLFSDLLILSEKSLLFDFFGVWKLELFDKPKRSLSYLFSPLYGLYLHLGATRPLSLTRYFSLKSND